MESLLFAGALAVLIVMLVRQSPSADGGVSDRRGDWPRLTVLLVASAGAAFLTGRETLEAWFAQANPNGSALETNLGWIAILPLAAAAIIGVREFFSSTSTSMGAPITSVATTMSLAQPAAIEPAGPGRSPWLMIGALLIGGAALAAIVLPSLSSAVSGWWAGPASDEPKAIATPSSVPSQAGRAEMAGSASSPHAARQDPPSGATNAQPSTAKLSRSRSDRPQQVDRPRSGGSRSFGERPRQSDWSNRRRESQRREEQRQREWHPRLRQLPADEFQQ